MESQLDYLAHLRADSTRFADVLAATDPAAPVPPCPGWTAADLLWHLGEVQHSWGTFVRERLQDPDDYREPERPAGYDALLAFYQEASADLAAAIESTPDATPVWTWFEPDRTAGFIRRRQAHEAVIHRLDAELTAGTLTDVDADLATDGVLEVLEWMYSGVPGWATPGDPGPAGRIATTDTGASWLVQLGSWSGHSPNSGKTYPAEPTLSIVPSGDAVFEISGTARDLDAWLWNRPTLTEITRSGDYAAFESVIRSGVQ
ncbi:MAG: maleylpyruvate isomerase family mycothiol-dependent enzyme [Jatrophihabitantaceae bacterium]